MNLSRTVPNTTKKTTFFSPSVLCLFFVVIIINYPSTAVTSLTVATFNMLAPVHRSMEKNRRESEREDWWRPRAKQLAEYITNELGRTSDVVLLQEFWFGDDFVSLFDDITGDIFDRVAERRPGNMITSQGITLDRPREDGMAILVNKKRGKLKLLHSDKVLTGPQRIAQIVTCQDELKRLVTIANIHLSFPSHADSLVNEEKHAYEIMQITQALTNATNVCSTVFNGSPNSYEQPRLEIVGGDFNSDSHSLAARCLESNPFNFVNCASASAEQSLVSGSGGRVNLGVTHRTHRGEDVSVDHIFTRMVHNKEQSVKEEEKSVSLLKETNNVESAHLRLGYLDDKGTRVVDCSRGNGNLVGPSLISDHIPVIATLEWPDLNIIKGNGRSNIQSDAEFEGLYMPLDPLESPWGT